MALLERLADLRRSEAAEEDDRIFPTIYVPLIVTEDGRRVIKPMMYACRLAGKLATTTSAFLEPTTPGEIPHRSRQRRPLLICCHHG